MLKLFTKKLLGTIGVATVASRKLLEEVPDAQEAAKTPL